MDRDFNALKSVQLRFLVLNFLFDQFLLVRGKLHAIHLRNQLVPGLFFLFLFVLLFGVLAFYVSFHAFSSFASLVAWLMYLLGCCNCSQLGLGSKVDFIGLLAVLLILLRGCWLSVGCH